MKNLQNLRKLPMLSALLIFFIATSVYFWNSYQKEKTDKEFQVSVHKYFLARLEPMNDFVGDNVDDFLPVYLFTSDDAFSEAEKSEIFDKALYPFVMWERENGRNVVAMNVRRVFEDDVVGQGYKYTIDMVEDGGWSGGFMYGEKNPLEWWTPACEGDCNFSPEYKAKFPEVVSQAQ